jgi:DNA-binding CsgD family transcriptional regulator
MEQHHINIFFEIFLAILLFTVSFTVFYLLHRPASRQWRIMLIISMALQYPVCRMIYFAAGRNNIIWAICDAVIFLLFALVCGKRGNRSTPILSAVYLYGMINFIDFILIFYFFAFTGERPPSFSFITYCFMIFEGLLLLAWAYFYYRTLRKQTPNGMTVGSAPFWLITVLTPPAGIALMAYTSKVTPPLLGKVDANIFLIDGLFGTLILLFNISIFYLYIKLSVAYKAQLLAGELAHTPPVWTAEKGLSETFIQKYEISPRERQVVESALRGKSNKDIASDLYIAVNTVQVHLQHVYQKTGAPGRYALFALVGLSENTAKPA